MNPIKLSEINDKTLVVCVLGSCSVWDFCDETNKDETLARATASQEKDLALYQEYTAKYDNKPEAGEDRQNYWAGRYEAEKDKKYIITTYGEFEAAHRKNALSGPIYEITEERYWEMLEILPPMKWRTVEGVEMFLMREFNSGTFTNQFAKANGKFYEKTVDAYDESTWILQLLKDNHEIKEL